jgi:hypothetical protein
MPDVDPSSAQLWKVFSPICQLFLCKNDFATALTGDGGGLDGSRLVAQRGAAVPRATVAPAADGLRNDAG